MWNEQYSLKRCFGGVKRSLPLASRPAPSPAPSGALPSAPILNARALPRAPPTNAPAASSTRRRPPGRPLQPPAKRLRRTTSHDADPQSVTTVTTFAPPTPGGAPSLPMASGASDGLNALPGAVEPVVPLCVLSGARPKAAPAVNSGCRVAGRGRGHVQAHDGWHAAVDFVLG